MSINDEPVKHEVKQYKPCPARKNQWGKWKYTNHAQQGRTSEGSENIQTMPSKEEPVREVNIQTMPINDEPVRHEVKQWKPCIAMMNQWEKLYNKNNAH